MSRTPRCDGPGVWHHVMNRGIAKRTVFEDVRDVRYFLSRLARAVRSNSIEVHAYCIMTTHFHLLLRSPDGGLSRVMCRVLDDYVRWFNRGRHRDGSLFRGRFRSRPVESIEYRRRLVQYIDFNPVRAGLVVTPASYPHGSARWYTRQRRPAWLDSTWIEAELRQEDGHDRDFTAIYGDRFSGPLTPSLARVIERRVESGIRARDPLDELLGVAPERILDWMRKKAALADGTSIDLPVCDPQDVRGLIAEMRMLRSDWRIDLKRHKGDGWQILEVALLRELCGSSWTEIGRHVEISDRCALRAYRHHGRAIEVDPEYAQTASRLATAAVTRCYGSRQRQHLPSCG